MPIFSKSRRKPHRGAKTNRRRSSRSSKRVAGDDGNLINLGAVIVGPIIALGAVSYAVMAYLDEEQPDANHCYARDDQHQAVIFVDNSIQDESGAHIRDYRTGMMRVYENAPANSLIKITTTARTDGGSFAPPVFTLCKPAATQAEQAAIGAPEKSAPVLRRIAGEALAEYAEMVDSVVADMEDPDKTANDSPILSQIRAISLYDGFEGPNRSLTVITDGVNNSEIARFCAVPGDMPPFDTFKMQQRYSYVEPRSFEGVEVTILLVEFGRLPAPGLSHCTNNSIRDWWPAFFKGNGAISVDLRRLRYWEGS